MMAYEKAGFKSGDHDSRLPFATVFGEHCLAFLNRLTGSIVNHLVVLFEKDTSSIFSYGCFPLSLG